MLVTLLGIVMLVRPVQLWKAPIPMLVTLLGIVMLARLSHQKNASSPMLVTGFPSISDGIVIAPFAHSLQSVMIIVPSESTS